MTSRECQGGKQDTIHLFIKSDGGNGQASLRLVNLLRQYCNRLVALAPLECASAATMIALGADEIMMGPMAFLTSVDTSLTHDLSPIEVYYQQDKDWFYRVEERRWISMNDNSGWRRVGMHRRPAQ